MSIQRNASSIISKTSPFILDELVFHSRKNRILYTSRNIWRLPKKIKKTKNCFFYKKTGKMPRHLLNFGSIALTPVNFYFSQFGNFSTVKNRAPNFYFSQFST